ncbi:MAG: M20/M25/M40 family metallo-hydrolase [Treponema sp.]|jgi:carboxypeptidase PM20D1|nr:M20/M25/M40 family metallo-hydrolase [Treponema sp.]
MEREGAVERFRRAIRIRTDWPENARGKEPPPEVLEAAEAPLRAFQDFLAVAYPRFFRTAEHWVLNPYALVFRWPGASSGAIPGPEAVLILAHYDVVPVEADKWSADPFGAEIKGGFLYGRGAQDMKGNLIALMEAAEELSIQGFRPRRDIWFAFGGDEERSGLMGAQTMAAWFAGRGQRFSWILDEGSPVTINQIRGINIPLALFSVEEKGFLSLELAVDQKPGHSSRPPRVQAVALLARALLRISRRPFPVRLSPTVAALFSHLTELRAQERGRTPRPWAIALTTAILSALGPLVAPILALGFRKDPQILALLCTTVAMTQLEGSPADNVMPSRARAVINLRLLAPWSVDDAINYISWIIGDDRVKIRVLGFASSPVPAHPEHGRERGPGWEEMAKAVRAVFPGAVPIPFIMTAATDSRHYQKLAGGIFRFSPMRLSPADMSSVHGHDERISLENFFLAIKFYTTLIGML